MQKLKMKLLLFALLIGIVFTIVCCTTTLEQQVIEPPSSTPTTSTLSTTTTTTITTTTTTTSTTATTTTSTTTTTTTIIGSISGKVNFVSSSTGIRGGVLVNVSGTVTKIATTENSTGTYEVSGLPTGTYVVAFTKEGWSISSLVITIESQSLQNCNVSAEPTGWEVLRISGNITLESIVSMEATGGGNDPGAIYAVGTSSTIIKAHYPFTSWESVQSPAAVDWVVIRDGGGAVSIYSSDACEYVSVIGTAPFYFGRQLTTEAISDYAEWGAGSFEVVANGKVLRTINNGASYTNLGASSAAVNQAYINEVCTRFINGSSIYIVGKEGAAFKSENGGASWTAFGQSTFLADNLKGIWVSCFQDASMVIVSKSGAIFTSPDSGIHWERFDVPLGLFGAYTSPTGVLVCGENGLIMRKR